MKYFGLIVFISAFTASCSQQIEDYVDVDKDLSNTPITSTANSVTVKYSGGSQQSTGAQVDTNYSIGYKDRSMSGSQVDTTISISTYRPSLTQ